MRKNFGKKSWVFPCPVLIISTYDENGCPDAMNAAWGGIYDTNQVMLCLSDDHKTAKNILLKKAFTVSFADAAHVVEADYVGIVSANDVPNKLEKCGLHTAKSEFVDAPLLTDFPLAIECVLSHVNEDGIIVGNIVNVSADESVLDDKGNVDIGKAGIIAYNSAQHDYRVLGAKVGNAFSDGKKIK